MECQLGVLFHEIAHRPVVGEKGDGLVELVSAEGDAAGAVEHLRLAAASKADWMMPRILLGKALLGLDQRAEAKPWLEEALRLAVEQHHEEPEQELRALLRDLQP